MDFYDETGSENPFVRPPGTNGADESGPSRYDPSCETCRRDADFLRQTNRPTYEQQNSRPIRTIDLFCGCGGLTLGVSEGIRRAGLSTHTVLAIDSDPAACSVFETNFPQSRTITQSLERLFDGSLGGRPTESEREIASRLGHVDVLLAGPPCQGHSDLNNHTRRDDPRNALYLRAVRAAEVLSPQFIVLENVPALRHDQGRVLDVARERLGQLGYSLADPILDLKDLGLPQIRRRHVLVAGPKPSKRADDLFELPSCDPHLPRPVEWAIQDLLDLEGTTPFDSPATASYDNVRRIDWLFKNEAFDLPNQLRPKCHQSKHSYKSMYGRLRWDLPAQTITTGFGSMGQGRYVHPLRPRTITPHEAARLQTFPDFFDFGTNFGRSAWGRMIGNAAPPFLGIAIGAWIAGEATSG